MEIPDGTDTTGIITANDTGLTITNSQCGHTRMDTSSLYPLDPTKESVLKEFKTLDKLAREDLIRVLRVKENCLKLLNCYPYRYRSLEDFVLVAVSVKDLEDAHALLLLEEEIE